MTGPSLPVLDKKQPFWLFAALHALIADLSITEAVKWMEISI